MDKMESPNIYRSSADKLHTASDGQKFEVRTESLLASRSFKYFGQGQGVSAYTFVDEQHFLWHSTMISASDRESAYVIDGLIMMWSKAIFIPQIRMVIVKLFSA